MNKEEIKCITKEQLYQLEWSDPNEYGTTLAYELIKRLDKAIEHIEKNSELVKIDSKKHFDFYYREMKDVTELLEILKGDSNE